MAARSNHGDRLRTFAAAMELSGSLVLRITTMLRQDAIKRIRSENSCSNGACLNKSFDDESAETSFPPKPLR
jgi:hypothetical protein